MGAPSIRTDPALAAESPPKKEAAPAKETAGSGEQVLNATPEPEAQDPALAALCKSWMRCDAEARWQFLLDVKAAHPALFRAAMGSEVRK